MQILCLLSRCIIQGRLLGRMSYKERCYRVLSQITKPMYCLRRQAYSYLCSDNVSYSTTSALHNTFTRCRWSYKNDRSYKNSTHFSVFNKVIICWVLVLITLLDSTKMTLSLSLKLGVIFSTCILVL